MPSPNLNKQLAIARFQSFRIQLPTQVVLTPGGLKLAAAGAGAGVLTAGRSQMTSAARSVVAGISRPGAAAAPPPPPATGTPMSSPPALFISASNSVGDVNTQKGLHDGYMQLFDQLTEAIKHAWDMFRQQAYFKNVVINGPIATGGMLEGPAFGTLLKSAPSVAGWTGWWVGVRDCVGAGFENNWKEWHAGVRVPGLPWYPAFAAFPGPQAPPMPNLPCPLVSCPSAGLSAMSSDRLKNSLTQKLNGKMEYHAQFAEALAVMIATAFPIWLASQMVRNVMGKGSIPTFAPPYVPVGPVVGGDNIAAPGHLAA